MNAHAFEHPTVAISQARNFEKNELFVERHAPLASRLAEYGVRAVAINGAKDHASENIFDVSYAFSGSTLERREAPIAIDAGYDLTGGLARYVPDVAALNPLAVREIAMSKQAQFDALSPELGHAIARTVTVPANAEGVIAALEQFDDETLILKANGDPLKKHKMLVGTKDEIAKNVQMVLGTMNAEKESVLIQEYMPEVKSGFTDGIRLFDATERAVLADRRGLNRELRVHTFDGQPVYVTGRAGLQPEKKSLRDEWIYLDQESIPAHVRDLAGRAATLIQAHAGAEDSYLAVDLTPDASRVVEVNGRMIGTMRLDVSRPGSRVAHEVTTDALANKLAGMAYKRKGEK